jgi:protein-S-isoprenylcysteine O-methyltransferase Ste14
MGPGPIFSKYGTLYGNRQAKGTKMSPQNIIVDIFYKVATGSKKVRTLLTPIGFSFFFIFVGLFIFLSLWLDRLFGFHQLLNKPLNIAIALPVLIFGSTLILWSILHFLKVKGTPVPFHPPPKLVITGPYAYVRNPMLSGVFITLFGLGILLQSFSLFFIFVPLFILINYIELKTIEEIELEKRLGKEYLEYKRRIPMFFPRIKRKPEGK